MKIVDGEKDLSSPSISCYTQMLNVNMFDELISHACSFSQSSSCASCSIGRELHSMYVQRIVTKIITGKETYRCEVG
jgi:hypothetical protein